MESSIILFSDSEIIKNNNGSIYHLEILPQDLANIIITVGDPDRVDDVVKYFDNIIFEHKKREFRTITGYFKNKLISVISTGIGTDNIDIVLNEIHILKNFDLKNNSKLKTHTKLKIIRLGTSGSISNCLSINQILVSEMAWGFDKLHLFYNLNLSKIKLNHLIEAYQVESDIELFEIFKPHFDLSGITATMPGFYGPQGRNLNNNLQFNIIDWNKNNKEIITNLEMETAGLYFFGKLLNHQCISINAILANRITGKFSENPNVIIDTMIKKSLEIIANHLN